ncbi:hypothetical protein QFC22_001349 [Naganishia vaughanmartiniae]|uniref:Uncharacterized protein n=1 Tax=Naganishia vaughanmartiniae TaxID=1424756 RepID=A0ACC2XHQ1_9TREE|nr:hypothetical protein QFC22_001349 [Naganishia vaughanmartiniae]
MQQLQHRLRPESCITLIQNGMGVYDELCTTIWPDPVTRPQFILGSTTHGARLWTPKKAKPTSGGGLEFERSVVHTGEGEVVFGVVPDPRREVDYDQRLFGLDSAGNGTQQYSLAMPIDSPRLPLPSLSPSTSNERTTQTPLEATLTALLSLHELNPSLLPMPNMYRSLLQKLAVNCAVNPTTGLLAVLNGALVGSPHAGWLIRAIVEECSEVMTKYLASLASPTTTSADGTTHSPLDPETVAAFSPDSLERRTLQVLATTARNTSSMASDMSRLSLANPNSSTSSGGTEIEYITGYLARLGERMGIPTPVNRTMLELVKGKEEIYGMSPGMVVRSPDARVETRRANMGKKKVVEKQETVTAKI